MAILRPRRIFSKPFPRVPRGLPPEVTSWAEDLLRVLDIGWEPEVRIIRQTIDPATVSSNSTSEQTFTVLTLTTSDRVFINKPSHTPGIGIVNARVSAADTLAITFMNTTGSGINPPEETYTFVIMRGD